jgi:hypothetical protein
MIGKLSVLGFSLATAIASPALAHDQHDSGRDRHGRGDHRGDYRAASAEVDLRHADLNRDGYVTMHEALDSGRQAFRRQDRNNDWTLTRHEVGRPALRHDRNSDGRVSMREYQRRVRAQFARMDINRDGYLGRRELGYPGPRDTRPAGWRYR